MSVCVCACVCKQASFGKMCSPTLIPLPALDGGIGTVRYHGNWPHNGYHGNMRERQQFLVVKETKRLREEKRGYCDQILEYKSETEEERRDESC